MTSGNVSNLPIQTAAVGTKTGKAEQIPQKGEFVQFMDKNMKNTAMKSPKPEDAGRKTDVKAPVKVNHQGEKMTKVTEKQSPDEEVAADVTEKVEGFSKEVEELLTDKLEVTEEDVEQVLETMGLTFLDLTNPTKLVEVLSELQDVDTVELLLDENVTDLFSQVKDLTGELQEATGMTAEEMKQWTAVMEEASFSEGEVLTSMPETEAQPDVAPLVPEEAIEFQQRPEGVMNPETVQERQSAEVTVEEVRMQEMPEATQETDEADVRESVLNETTAPVKEPEQKATSEDTTGNGRQEMRREFNEHPSAVQNQTVQVQTTFFEPESNVITMASGDRVDVVHVIDQIVEQARTVISREVTTMEMLLNPEGLGKILMQVSEKEGQITAKIYTQDPVVKEALENQIILLKDQLNETGTKVQSIEVAVATHEFERNLEEGQQQDGQEQNPEQRRNARNFNLNNLDELSGLMTEEEELVAKIMRDNGNTVNFTA